MNFSSKFFFILIIISFLACNKATRVKIEFDDAAGLTEKSSVFIRGFRVGEVKSISIQSNSKVLVEIVLTEEIAITNDAEFTISSTDLLGTKSIVINNGSSKEFINLNEIHKGASETSLKAVISDSTKLHFIEKLSNNFSQTKKLDSLENELIKVNKNIESLRKAVGSED